MKVIREAAFPFITLSCDFQVICLTNGPQRSHKGTDEPRTFPRRTHRIPGSIMSGMSSSLQTPGGSFLLINSSSSAANRTSDARCVDHDALQTPLAVLYSVVFILGLVGNLVALWVFLCVHSKKNSVRVFLINTALADLLLVVCVPFRILYHSQGNTWSLGPTLCKVVGNLFYMNMYISVVLLGLISVDRYLKINRSAAVQHKLFSTKRSTVICGLLWVLSFFLILSLLLAKDLPDPKRCFQYKRLQDNEWKAYINVFVIVVFWLVFVALMVSYGKIALKLLRTSHDKPDLPNAAHYTRTAKKSFFILFVFTVCFVPYHMVRAFYIKTQITETPCSWQQVADVANEVALVFSAFNSCLDPVMYFLLSSSVRKEVLRVVSHIFSVHDVVGVSGSSSADREQMNASLKKAADPESGQA